MTVLAVARVAASRVSPPLSTPADVAAAAAALEREGRDVLRLEVGEPDFATPAHVVEAGVAAMRDGRTRYAPPAGIPELRAAVAGHVAARGVSADASRVVVAPGAKLLLGCVLLAALRDGDEVLVPDPGYPAYASAARRAGARAVPYRMDDALDVAALAALVGPRTRAIVLNSPHNPTGAMLDARTLAAIAGIAERHDLLVVSDEIYGRLSYDGAHASIAALPGMAARTALVDGFSKSHAMTGWRLAYGVLPPALVAPVTALLADTASCTPPFVQHAGLAALTGPDDEIARRVAELRARRDALVATLAGDGVTCAAPAGGLYVFPRLAALREPGDEERLVRRLLDAEGIACVPGTAFGTRGAGRLRLALTAPPPALRRAGEAVRRQATALRGAPRARAR